MFFPNTFIYFSGISFQLENFELVNLLIHDAFKDVKINFYIYHFKPILLKFSYQCISFNLKWFPIPYKFNAHTLYLFFVFSGITHELTIKVRKGIIKAE